MPFTQRLLLLLFFYFSARGSNKRHSSHNNNTVKSVTRKIKLYSVVCLSKLMSWFESTHHVRSLALIKHCAYEKPAKTWITFRFDGVLLKAHDRIRRILSATFFSLLLDAAIHLLVRISLQK